MRESHAAGCLGTAELPRVSRRTGSAASRPIGSSTSCGRGPAVGRAAPAVDSAIPHVRLSASLGRTAWPDAPSREQEGRVSGAAAEAVVGASAIVYSATACAGLDQPSQPQ